MIGTERWRSPNVRLAALVAAALGVRLVHLATIHAGPLFRYLLIDSAFYDAVGRRLATGGGFPEGPFFMNVLYGVFLGVIYAPFGAGDGGKLAVLVIQSILGAVSCGLTVRLGAALGRPRDGWIAGVLLAVFGPAVFYDGALLTPSLLLFLTVAALLVAARQRTSPSWPRAAGLGVLLGLLILGRANHLLLLVGLAILLARGGRAQRGAAAVMTLVALAVVAPVTVRNVAQSGAFVPVTANGGMVLWAGNHEGATGIYSEPAFLGNPVPEREAEDYRLEASRRAGRDLTLAESSRYWERATWHAWTTEPGRTARLFLRKLRFWFHATESQTNLSYYFAIDQAPVLRILRLHLGWILPLAIVGLLAGGWREPLLTLPIAVSIVTCLVFYMSSEYRHPVVPCLLLLAAAGGRVSLDVFRHAVIWRRVALGAGLVALLVLANFRDPFLARLQSRRVDYVNFGTLAAQAGDLEVAERLFRRSIAIDPDWDVSRAKLAEVLQRLGRPGEAIEELRAAEAGAGEPSPMMAASELFRAGRLEEARAAFVAIAEAGGEESAAALNNAGLCSMQLGDVKGAVQAFEASRSLDSLYASPVIHLGRLALAIGDSTAAARYADEAVELAPQDGRAQRLQARARGEVSPGEADEGMD